MDENSFDLVLEGSRLRGHQRMTLVTDVNNPIRCTLRDFLGSETAMIGSINFNCPD